MMPELTISALSDPDIDALKIGESNSPTYIELRARGADRADESAFLSVVGYLLGKIGFESHPVDTHPAAREVILPLNWRDLPIVRRALAGGPA